MCLLGSPFKSAVLASPDQVKKHGRDCSWRCSHGSQKRVLPPSQHELKFDLHIVSTPLSTVCTTFRWSHIVLSSPKHPAHGEFGTLFLVLYPCDGVSLLGRPARGNRPGLDRLLETSPRAEVAAAQGGTERVQQARCAPKSCLYQPAG